MSPENDINITKAIGYRIAALRQKKFPEADAKDIAAKMGISPQQYSKFETGNRRPSDKNMEKLANLFGVNVSEITNICRTQDKVDELSDDDENLVARVRFEKLLRLLLELHEVCLNSPDRRKFEDWVDLIEVLEKTLRTQLAEHFQADVSALDETIRKLAAG